jgi:putative hydrolase of the HAD superfamily
MIKAVLFDFGGVLTEGGKAGSIAAIFAKLFGIKPEQLNMGDLHYRLRSGLMATDEFFAEMNRRHSKLAGGKTITEAQFTVATDTFTRCTEVYNLVDELRTQGIRTGILSNVFEMSVAKLRKRGFYDGFDPVILSCEVHMTKPDVNIYHIAIEHLGLQPEEILFIDDQKGCLAPAAKLGMHTILAVSPKQIVSDAKRLIQELNGT